MSSTPPRSRRRGKTSARDALRAKRSQAPLVNPCPPGPVGGQYKPLTESDIQQIYRCSLRVLEEVGMGEATPELQAQALKCGAFLNEKGRLCFPVSMVEDIVASAAREFVFYGRDPRHDFELGGDRVHFGTGGAAVQTLDMDTGLYRSSTLSDLYDFTRLVDTLTNVSWFTRCCVATDVADNFELDVNTVYALLKGTTKPVATSFTLAEHVDPIVDMFDWVAGGTGKYRQRPFCKAHISPVISPLRYGADAVDVTLACMRRGVPISNIVAAQSGATSPATLAGVLVTSLAETLAALIMVNVFEPSYPMIFSNWPLVIDLRSGAFCGGGGESTLLNAASAQLSNWLGLPSGAASSMSDAKAIDAQMGVEKALSALGVGLAGCNMIYESLGMTSSLLGASFEAFLIDDEMLSHVYRVLRGIEVTEETLGFDYIVESVYGEGHFLGGEHTMEAMERDYFYPSDLSNRMTSAQWGEEGAEDMWAVANRKARQILSSHQPDYLGTELDRRIRDQFRIYL